MTCPVCSEKLPAKLKHVSVSEYAYFICPLCGSYILDPLPGIDDSIKIYESSDYFIDGYIGYFEGIDIQIKNFDQYVRKLIPFIKKDALIAEIGSGSGAFIMSMHNYGYKNVTGYELNPHARQKAKKAGLDVRSQDELFQRQHSDIDLLCMFDVIEHVPNPRDFLAQCKDILAPNGLIVIFTADNKSIASRLLGKMWWFLTPPDHCIIYTRDSMQNMLQKLDYEVIDNIDINCYFTSVAGIFNKIFHKLYLEEKPALWRRFDKDFLKNLYVPIYHFSDFLVVAKNVPK
jgi:SAM-dependent methyltransferase